LYNFKQQARNNLYSIRSIIKVCDCKTSSIILKLMLTIGIGNHLALTSLDQEETTEKRRLRYRHSFQRERGERRPKLVSGVPLGPHPE